MTYRNFEIDWALQFLIWLLNHFSFLILYQVIIKSSIEYPEVDVAQGSHKVSVLYSPLIWQKKLNAI